MHSLSPWGEDPRQPGTGRSRAISAPMLFSGPLEPSEACALTRSLSNSILTSSPSQNLSYVSPTPPTHDEYGTTYESGQTSHLASHLDHTPAGPTYFPSGPFFAQPAWSSPLDSMSDADADASAPGSDLIPTSGTFNMYSVREPGEITPVDRANMG